MGARQHRDAIARLRSMHQRIEIRDISWDSTSLNGRVVTTLAARRAALDSVVLDAAAGITIRRAA